MYLEYFGLQRHPFRITPDPLMFWPGGGRGEILEALIYAITTGEGIIKVVGEVGSGKTMLCRILEERLPQSVVIVYLANPRLSPADILHAIAFELNLPVTATTGRLLLMQHLQDYLLDQHGAGRSVVVFIEEAQGMPIETLEEIRLLSNLETHRHKLLQIILFGQPELENNLRKRHIRQLKERITHSFYLAPLGVTEVTEYIRFRLQVAGSSRSGLFDRGAVGMIAKASHGLIRRINILADKAMLAAYAASGTAAPPGDLPAGINSRHVRAAIGDCEFGQPTLWPFLAIFCSLFFVVLAVVAWQRFPFAKSLPSLLAIKTMVAESMPFVGSGKSIDPGNDDSGHRGLMVKSSGDEIPVTNAERRESVRETVSIEPLAHTDPPSLPVSEQFFSQTAGMPVEGYVHEEGKSDKPVAVTSLKATETSETRLLDLRRGATAQWLQRVHPENYTIQLLAASVGDETHLEKFFQRISSESVLERSYICLVRQGDKDLWIVLYDEFPGINLARRALDNLPPELHRSQPFVRSLQKVLGILQTENQ